MRVALGQMNPTVGDLAGNVTRALECARSAQRAGADLLVLGAFALTGAPLFDLEESDAFVSAARVALEAFAVSVPLPTIFGHILPSPDDVAAVQSVFCEAGSVTVLGCDIVGEGADALYSQCTFGGLPRVTVAGEPVAVSTFMPLPSELGSVTEGASLLVATDALPWRGYDQLGVLDVSSSAVEAALPIAWVNLVGGADTELFAGGSVAVDQHGGILAGGFLFDETVVIADTDAGDGAGLVADPLGAEEAEWSALVLATRDYVEKSGFSDVLIGLSGGLDSAVVATIAVDALGADRVQGILMPGPYSSEGSVSDALELASDLGIATRTIPIGPSLEALTTALSQHADGVSEGTAHENLQARIRGTYLMTLSNAEGSLVLNTGNKSEAAVGYSTLHGDTVGAFAPLADVYKTRVAALARWRAGRSPSIPEASITKEPSAELRPGQSDRDTLPPYDELDAVLALHLEGGLGLEGIVGRGYDRDLVTDALGRVSRAEYKRRLEPLGPTMTTAAFGDARWWPVTNRWTDVG